MVFEDSRQNDASCCEFDQRFNGKESTIDSDSMEESVSPNDIFGTSTEAWKDSEESLNESWSEEDDTLEQLIEVSIRKIQQLQSFHRKDERRRVLIVNMLHSLLMKKVYMLKEQGGLVGEDSNLLNNLLQEKISGLGLGRSVRIWVDAPSKPGQTPTLKLPTKGSRKEKGGRKAEDADGDNRSENGPAPSGRDTASF